MRAPRNGTLASGAATPPREGRSHTMILVDTSVWVDLLASAALATPAALWTRDRRLAAIAAELSLAQR